VHDPAGQPHEHTDHHQHAQQTQLFPDDGQQEVGVGFRQPVQFLHTATQPDTEHLSPAIRNQGM
jgi:hypothetical protein